MITLNPRKRFQESNHQMVVHRELVVSGDFLNAASAALLETVMAAPDPINPDHALAEYSKILGARNYLRTLLNIAEQPELLKNPQNVRNLNHNP